LKLERRYLVEKKQAGIYTVSGDILPIQIIDSRKLTAKENLWLKNLDNGLGAVEIDRAYRQRKAGRLRAYFNVITEANPESYMEVLKMRKSKLTLNEMLEEAGYTTEWVAKGEAKGEAKKAAEIAQKMLKKGFSVEQTAELSGLDISKVRVLPT
jgi:predicted transposase YdaD